MIYVNGMAQTYIFMAAEVLEEFYFPQCAFSQDPFGEDVGDLQSTTSKGHLFDGN